MDVIKTRAATPEYRDNYDQIFRKTEMHKPKKKMPKPKKKGY